MLDQANDLRELVLRASLNKPSGTPPRLVVLSGGKGGVGTTTLALELARALARDGRRTVLVDADLTGPDVANLCGIEPENGHIGDVLAGRRTVHEVLQPGPEGIQLLPGDPTAAAAGEATESALRRFLAQLEQLGPHAEYVVIDAGNGAQRAARPLWRKADLVWIVTSTEVVSVMDAYATIKVLSAGEGPPALSSIVNQAPDVATAADVHHRMSRACKRFLGLSLSSGGSLPHDALVEQRDSVAQHSAAPPHGALAAAMDRLVASLTGPQTAPRARARQHSSVA